MYKHGLSDVEMLTRTCVAYPYQVHGLLPLMDTDKGAQTGVANGLKSSSLYLVVSISMGLALSLDIKY